ncbi:hypothetical protein [Nocardioides sp. SYSU D00038]|uniref:hypothetical protein n=1 Tax=Nocardioides sp. SYSU D00038 TaxID=2812554 RepID=UPI001967A05E|nr:hypothetical protein [Nocardioides sp. SYSU D00038]
MDRRWLLVLPVAALAAGGGWWAGSAQDGGAGTSRAAAPVTASPSYPGASEDVDPATADGLPLTTVFPSLDPAACAERGDILVVGKTEVWECKTPELLVRYTRWEDGFDRFGYYDEANRGFASTEWLVDGVLAGRTWESTDRTVPRQEQWSATYRDWPFSVSVEATGDAVRDAGVAAVEALAPGELATLAP